ncbi:YchJ family protein [Pseudidiomarina sp.]|uniref:YchJ family protein n=1 Tax=Pseudidiomarina sp. TaxID=2081707 RepID=UPI00299EE725|nr:YchJ family metal-binding protein [Pseudidiomarina sp.]MDX1706862.1 YchJ family metal-binding protein [Pseudidiomarina sp.]
MAKCPCGAGKYHKCCEPYHKGKRLPGSPEALMRSRFSAFSLELRDYLLETWHQDTRPELDLADNPHWLQLQVVESWQRGNRGYVHFRAFFEADGQQGKLEEKSDFVKEGSRWYYVSGEII